MRLLDRISLAAALVFAFVAFNTGVAFAETGTFDTRKSIPNEDKLIKLAGSLREGLAGPLGGTEEPLFFGPFLLGPGDSVNGTSELNAFPEDLDVFSMIGQEGGGSILKMEVMLDPTRTGDTMILVWLVIRPGFEPILHSITCISLPRPVECILEVEPFPQDSVAVAVAGFIAFATEGPPAPYGWRIDLAPLNVE